MKKLDKPSLRVAEVREACEQSIHKDSELKQHLNSVSTHLDDLERDYESQGSAKTWFQISEQKNVAGLASKKDMSAAYTQLRSRKSCRPLYDQLLQAPDSDDCPYCGERESKTLDHYLAKAKHPGLSITPINLVPSCYPCNNTKNDRNVANAEEQFLHPYYDDVSAQQWLFASVTVSQPASFVFYVDVPTTWDATIRERIIHHFEGLKLNELYVKKAARKLSGIRGYLDEHLYRVGGGEKVRQEMEAQADSFFIIQKNHWETAFYQACADSDWFCNEGFIYK